MNRTHSARLLLRFSRVALLLAGGVLIVAMIFPLLAEAQCARIKQRWSRWLVAALGVTLCPDPIPPDTLPAGLLVANHISFLDIFVINALMPLTFVAKSDVSGWPLIGWLTARTGNLFIERGNRQAAYAMQTHMAETLRSEQRLCIFPEGTSSTGETVLPFHAALLESAIEAEKPVICLALGYQDEQGGFSAAPAFVGQDTLLESLRRIASHPGLVARIRCVGVLPTVGMNRRQLGHLAHQHIAQGVIDLHRKRPATPL